MPLATDNPMSPLFLCVGVV